jgi:Ca2+-binding RTX toxin-like protein
VIVWAAPDTDGSSDVLLQKFNAQGNPQFQQPIRVNTIAAGKQYQPSVELLENDRLLVTYTDEKSVRGVPYGDAYQRIFDADGQPLGPETPLSAWLGSSWNRETDIAYLGGGKWIAAWSNWNQGNDPYSGVSQRVFSLADAPVLDSGADVALGTDASEELEVRQDGLSDGDRILGGGGSDTLKMLYSGELNLAAPLEFSGIESIEGSGGADTIVANAARLKDIATIQGGAGLDELRLFDGGSYDLRGKTLSGIERITLTDFVTTVTVDDVETGLLILGNGVDDKVILSGGSFTKAERYRLFKQGIETVQDDGGTYVKTLGEILNLNGDQSFAQAGSTVRLDDEMDSVVPTAPPSYLRLTVTISNFIPGHDRLIVSNVGGVSVEDGGISVDGVGVGWFMSDVTKENMLDISLLPTATPERVQKLLRALSYMNIATGATVSGQRTVNILLEDVGGSTTGATVNVNVLGQGDNIPPTVSFLSPGPVSGTDTGLVSPLATIRVKDGDRQDDVTVTVSFTPENGSLVLGAKNFGIYDPTNGTYTVTGDPDDVTDDLRALQFDPRDRSDSIGHIESTEFTIHVNDGRAQNTGSITVNVATANRAPDKPVLSNASIKELAADGTVIGTVSGSDPNQGDAVTYSLVGAEDAPVRLETRNGVVHLVVTSGIKLDYEQRQDYVFTLRATDSQGLSNDTVVVLKVDDVSPESTAGASTNDVIKGGAGKDSIGGGFGNDRLWGGLGNDVLTGGKGKDIFVFDTKANAKTNVDKIGDFSAKDDSIWLDNKIFTTIRQWHGAEARQAGERYVLDRQGRARRFRPDHLRQGHGYALLRSRWHRPRRAGEDRDAQEEPPSHREGLLRHLNGQDGPT